MEKPHSQFSSMILEKNKNLERGTFVGGGYS